MKILMVLVLVVLAGCGGNAAPKDDPARLEEATARMRAAQDPNRALTQADVEYRTAMFNSHKEALTHIETDKIKLDLEKERVRYAADTNYCTHTPRCASFLEHTDRMKVRPCLHKGCTGAGCVTCRSNFYLLDCTHEADGALKPMPEDPKPVVTERRTP